MRTSLALLAAGISAISLFDNVLAIAVGWLLVPLGLLAVVVGAVNYCRTKRLIDLASRTD